jgi:hypothetical protein
MRHCLMLFLLILTSLHVQAQAPVNTGVQTEAPREHQNPSGEKTPKQTPGSSFDSGDGSKTDKSTSGQEENNGKRNPNDRTYRVNVISQPTSGWTIAYVICTVVLSGLGLATLVVLIFQIKELRKQVRLQERGLRQWVNTSHWEAGLTGRMSANGERVLEISFRVSNVTRAPITLKLVRAESEEHRDSLETGNAFPENTMLLPISPYRHSFRISLTDEEYSNYVEKGIMLPITGMIFYTDALGDAWTQRFQLLLATSPSSDWTSNYFHVLGSVKTLPITAHRPFWRKAIDWWVIQVEEMKSGKSTSD